MTRKRRMFDIDMPEDEVTPASSATDAADRRGPMAAAVRENAESLRERRSVEERIRAENDALAHEHVRLKRAGLILDMVPTHLVDAQKLTRDRAPGRDDALEELKASIMAIGLSNPIRVEKKANGRFELIQGWRRLRAFIELEGLHRDGRFTHIPAGYVAGGDDLALSYRRMVDENLIRKDISFAEMAKLAQAYVADPETGCDDIDKAVATLFQSAGYQKRSYIRAFAELLVAVGDGLAHPQALGRNLGLDVRRRLDGDRDAAVRLTARLAAAPNRTAEEEAAILRDFVAETARGAPRASPSARPAARAKTTLRIGSALGEVRCLAVNGRLELRAAADFAAVEPRRLESAVAAFIAAMTRDREGG